MPNLDLLPVELLERIATHLLGDAAYHHNLAALRLTSVRLATILSRFQAFTIPFNATFELSALPAFAKDLHILDSDFFFLGKGREPDGQGFRGGRSPDHEAVCIHNLKLSFVDQHEISLSSLSLNSFLVSESLVSLCLSSSKDNHHQLTIGKDLDQFHNLTSLSLVNLQVKDPYIFFQSLSSLHRLVHISICIANIQENEQPLNLDLSRLSPLLESISITGNYTSPVPLHLSATSTCPKLKTLILDCGISPDGPHWNHFPNL